MTVPKGTQQGWTIYVHRPRTIFIPFVRETDARQMVQDYLDGLRPLGPDWVVDDGGEHIANAVLFLSPNEYPGVAE